MNDQTHLTANKIRAEMAVVQSFVVVMEKFSIFSSGDAVKGTLSSLGGIRAAT
jgi:hypothetical protein